MSKAPDKIVMDVCSFSDIGLCNIDEDNVEYIRKDTLLEWLNEQKRPVMGSTMDLQNNCTINEIVRHIYKY